MNRLLKYIAFTLLLGGFAACDNTTEEIGSSLIQEEPEVIIHNEFSLAGKTLPNAVIESRTVTQLLGDIDAEGYGEFSSDFVCQFMPADKLVTEGVTVDSMKLILAYNMGGFVGDSVVPMGLEVFRLNRRLPSPIYSDFNPEDYCDVNARPLAEKIYVANAQGENDSIRNLQYREVKVDLPLSLANELFNLYVENPEAYSFPSNFAKYFPGIYVRNSFGAGRLMQIQRTNIIMYYHTVATDSEGKEVKKSFEGNYFAVTPEVVSNNNITFTIDPALQARIDAGAPIIVAPVGRDVEITFPLRDVIDYYNANRGALSVVNTLSMEIPASVIENAYGINPPENLLMVLSSEKNAFFLNNSLSDDKTSFIAAYNSTKKSYTFSAMRTYFINMFEKYGSTGLIDPDDITFILTPVSVTTETTSNGYNTTTYVSAITPYVGRPAMTQLNLAGADITFRFSKQTLQK